RSGLAGVAACDVKAGIIASSSGKASTAPAPRRNVRRGRAFFVTIMGLSSLATPHFKRRTLDDSQNQLREAIVIVPGLADDFADGGRVISLDAPSESIGQKLLGQRAHEELRAGEQGLLQTRDAGECAAPRHAARGIDGLAGVGRTPAADRVEILQRKS